MSFSLTRSNNLRPVAAHADDAAVRLCPGVRRRRHSVLVDHEVLLAAVAVSVGEEPLKVHKCPLII